jgi:AAA15 family ATPase/GTPase
MKKTVATVVAALAVVAFAGTVLAEEKFPTQEATVKTVVTTPDGKVVKEDIVTDTTKGADTTVQYKELQKEQAEQEMKTEAKKEAKKPAATAKKKASKKKAKKAAVKAKEAAAPAATEAPAAQ